MDLTQSCHPQAKLMGGQWGQESPLHRDAFSHSHPRGVLPPLPNSILQALGQPRWVHLMWLWPPQHGQSQRQQRPGHVPICSRHRCPALPQPCQKMGKRGKGVGEIRGWVCRTEALPAPLFPKPMQTSIQAAERSPNGSQALAGEEEDPESQVPWLFT